MATVRYPSEFQATPNTDYLQIESIRRNYSSSSTPGGTVGGNNTIVTGPGAYTPASDSRGTSSLILNMPQKISESFSQQYRNTSLGPEASNILSGRSSMAKSGEMVGDIFRRMVENFALDSATQALSKLGASSLSDNAILSATSGIIYNPMMEVLYDGPQFRTFNFQFALLAKSKKDAESILKIVRFFQWASVPSYGGSVEKSKITGVLAASNVIDATSAAAQAAWQGLNGNFSDGIKTLANAAPKIGGNVAAAVGTSTGILFGPESRFITQPPLLQITYKRGSNTHPYILPLKPCSINSLSIDYTPGGNYTVLDNFQDSDSATTVGTTITITMTEIKTMFASDYESNGILDRYSA